MDITWLIGFGFWGSVFAMIRFGKYCRLLNRRDLDPEETAFFQRKARWWLKAVGVLLGLAVLAVLVSAVTQ